MFIIKVRNNDDVYYCCYHYCLLSPLTRCSDHFKQLIEIIYVIITSTQAARQCFPHVTTEETHTETSQHRVSNSPPSLRASKRPHQDSHQAFISKVLNPAAATCQHSPLSMQCFHHNVWHKDSNK